MAAWDAVGRDVTAFNGKFRDAVKEDPSIGVSYPAAAAFAGVRTAINARGQQTRKDNARAKKKAAEKVAQAPKQ